MVRRPAFHPDQEDPVAEPVLRQLDSEKWQDVRAVQIGERHALVREKWRSPSLC